MEYSRLLMICPDEIDQVMHRARLLYVHAYSEWEFFTISAHYAVLALEASLRAVYDKWLGTENVEVTATIQEKQNEPKKTIIIGKNSLGKTLSCFYLDKNRIKVNITNLCFTSDK